MQIVARVFTHAQFAAYVKGLNIPNWAHFIVVHNTSAPDIKLYTGDWIKRDPKRWSPEIWLRNLTSYYAGKGWGGAPHLFIPPVADQIMVLNSLTVPGVHSPSWNRFSIGVETVGEFEREAFDGPVRANLIFALATLHEKLGLRPDGFSLGSSGLHFHKEDRNTTHKTCPGRHMVKTDLVDRVLNAMGIAPGKQTPDEHEHGVPVASQTADTNGMSIQELTSVKWLQMHLNSWGAKQPSWELLTVDGVRGPKTTTATRAFQKVNNNLVVDGIAGPVTRALLKKLTA